MSNLVANVSNTVDRTYSIPTIGGLLEHFPARSWFVRDADDIDEDIDTEMLWAARAHSGDYFMTLATELDKLAQSMTRGNDQEAAQLERLVSELLYFNQNYSVIKKED